MDQRKPIFDAIREGRGTGFTTAEVGEIDRFLDRLGVPRTLPAGEPAWITTARLLIGTREIAGARHNPTILSFWRFAQWFKDDETPWCGGFAMHCINKAGLAFPKEYPRAAAWATWGVACQPQIGAVGVKKRDGGNHVFFIVGQTPDRRFYKALGGNQGNQVCIVDIAKSDVFAVRWPAGVPQANMPLPIIAPGTFSGSEA